MCISVFRVPTSVTRILYIKCRLAKYLTLHKAEFLTVICDIEDYTCVCDSLFQKISERRFRGPDIGGPWVRQLM